MFAKISCIIFEEKLLFQFWKLVDFYNIVTYKQLVIKQQKNSTKNLNF
jgi:hypothetical protein